MFTIRGLEAPGFEPGGGKAAARRRLLVHCSHRTPLRGAVLNGNGSNPTGFPGQVVG